MVDYLRLHGRVALLTVPKNSGARKYAYDYPHPALAADIAVFCRIGGRDSVLLVRRRDNPFAGAWALPGGFVNEGELPIDAARREAFEETGLRLDDLSLVNVYGEPGRDPRGWTVSTLYTTRVSINASAQVVAGDDAAALAWHAFDALPPLAFDHDHLINDAWRAQRHGKIT
jgi:8-oxo-dGTP diphosphatase